MWSNCVRRVEPTIGPCPWKFVLPNQPAEKVVIVELDRRVACAIQATGIEVHHHTHSYFLLPFSSLLSTDLPTVLSQRPEASSCHHTHSAAELGTGIQNASYNPTSALRTQGQETEQHRSDDSAKASSDLDLLHGGVLTVGHRLIGNT